MIPEVIILLLKFVIVYLCFKLLKGIYTVYLADYLGFGVEWRPSPKTWVVVTGATDGIGLEYSKRFAQMGYSLLLLSRNRAKLEVTKTQLLGEFKKCKQINVLDVDFTKNDIYDRIKNEINKLDDIDVLFNNVGMGGTTETALHEYFLKNSSDLQTFIPALINCNMLSMTRMIQLILPKMVDNRRGIIINNASASGTFPLPLLAQYSASKAYMDYISRALEIEYRDKGIVIQSLLPGIVPTKLVGMDPNQSYIGFPSVKQFVDSAIKTVNIEKRTYGHWFHKLYFFQKDLIAMYAGVEWVSILGFYYQKRMRDIFYDENELKDDSIDESLENFS